MPDPKRILPLVTDAGPVCQRECPARVPDGEWESCAEDGREDVHTGMDCLPALRESWLREQERARQTCGMCVRGVGCPDADGVMDYDESCSRFDPIASPTTESPC